jgi:lipopolysaccharide heptosyltransferase II
MQELENTQDPIHIQREHDPTESGLLLRLPMKPKKIVILRASRIGDFINTLPVFRAIKQHLPESHLTVITLPMLFDLAYRCPDIDRVEAFPGYPGLAEQLFEARRTLHFFSQMQEERFDLALQMQGSGIYSNPFMLMVAARYTAGFIRPGDSPGRLDAALPLPEHGLEIERMLSFISFLGIPPVHEPPTISREVEDAQVCQKLLSHCEKPWIGFHAFARDATRRWPIGRFVEVAEKLQEQCGGTIVLLGEERDRPTIRAAFEKKLVRYENLAGRTSMSELISVCSGLSLLITNDTGPAHIAYALKTPVVVIFGAGDPTRNGPPASGPYQVLAYPVDCRPCDYHVCPIGTVCLENISVNEVVNASQKLLCAAVPTA